MKWSKPQLRILRFYSDHREQAPTTPEVLSQISLAVVFWFASSVILGIVLYLCGLHTLAIFLEGMSIGGLLNNIAKRSEIIELWPAIAAVVNFEKARNLVEEADEAKSD